MFSAGTADRDHKLVLSFFHILWNQEADQIDQFATQDLGFLILRQEIADLRIPAGMRPQFREIIRVRQEAHIEDQIGILRNAVFESKGKNRDHQTAELLPRHEDTFQLRAQVPCQKLAGVQDVVCLFF